MNDFVHVTGTSGHRSEYQALFASRLNLTPVTGRISLRRLGSLVRAERMLFATIDDDLLGYVLTAVLRAIRGRRTVGLFLRPYACFLPGWKAWMKRNVFRIVRHIPAVNTLSITPTDLFPAQAAVVSDWIHDPQLWDLHDCPDKPDAAMLERLRGLASGRKVLAFLGQVAPVKGFPLLVAMLEAQPNLTKKFCFVVVGQVSDPCRTAAERLKGLGVTIWPRRVTDAEMAAIYKAADLIWACYHPSYDQASGIFGRAVQRGRVAIIREGAMLGEYARLIRHPVIKLPYEPAEAAQRLAEVTIISSPPATVSLKWYRQSMSTIAAAL